MLCYLQTGHITFAPLRSNYRHLPNSITLRREAIKQLHSDPTHPFPASPKSIYRLADKILLPSLASLALENLKSQLTAENIAWEVHGDVAVDHEVVAEMELDFAVENWKVAGKSRAMKAVRKAVKGMRGREEMSMVLSERLA